MTTGLSFCVFDDDSPSGVFSADCKCFVAASEEALGKNVFTSYALSTVQVENAI